MSNENIIIEKYKNLLIYTFSPKKNQNDEINMLINEVRKKVKNPDSKLIEQMKEDKEFFSKKKFITSQKALERLSQLINAIKYKIPIMEEGPTGTSKTFTTLIAIDYLNYRKLKDNPNDKSKIKELLRFNLSSQTKSDDLLCQVTGDTNSPAGLKSIDGVFLRAFRDGYPLLLDEFNLASESVLQFILEAISSGILSIIINGKGLQEIHMHEDFCLIATQNPPIGMFAGKRNKFSIDFLSKFSKVKFDIELEELKEITRGSAKEFNYDNEVVIDEMVKFHEKWVKNYVSSDDVQCFTIRDILATIKLISEKKGVFESINAIYGARYLKEMKNKLQEVLKEFPHLSQKLNDNPPKLDEKFPFCFINDSLINTVNQCLFSLENGRNIIISGIKGCGKSYLAKKVSKFYNMKHSDKESIKQDNYCICTNKLECSDLIGNQKPSNKIQEGEEMLKWNDGFMTEGIRCGFSIILDNINEAPSTVTERLNGLLDKNYETKNSYFEMPENPKEPKIKINENFRIICVCEYEKIKKMSPAFINRFDVIVLEEQIEKNISDQQLKNLIGVILIENKSNIPEIEEEEENFTIQEEYGEAISEDNNSVDSNIDDNNENGRNSINSGSSINNNSSKDNENKSKSNNILTSYLPKINIFNMDEQEINCQLNKQLIEFVKKEDNKLYLEEIIKIIKKIDDFNIYNISKLIISIGTLYEQIQKENNDIQISNITSFVYDLIFSHEKEIEKIIINDKIMEFFEEKLEEEKGNDEKDDKYHFKGSESLRKFMVILMAASYIKLHLCVVGPPGGGKTTSARAFSRIRAHILEQDNVEPFRMYTFNESTKSHDFYGSPTLFKGKIKFRLGALGRSIKDGSVFIADEFNLTSIQTMKSVLPVLEPNFNKKIRIPGIDGPILFNENFFFIICQNDSNTLGRNLIPKELEYKLRTIYYPPAEIEDIKEICKNINDDINNSQNVNDKLPDDDAKKCGEYMMELNKLNQRILSPWSLRDIHKLFYRIANMRKKLNKFKNIGVIENILFYTMSSLIKENEDRILDDIIELIYKIFYKNNEMISESKKENLKKLYTSQTNLKIEIHNVENEEYTLIYLNKGYCKILYKEFHIQLKDEKAHKNLSDKLEKLKEKEKLPSFLNSLFKILLSNENEPLLLSGNTCYKKELSKEFLQNASVISLNQEITINQLLGSSSFLSKEDGKRFYLQELCNCLEINNLPNLMKYLNGWIEKEQLQNQNPEIKEKELLKKEIDEIKNKKVNDKFPFKIPVQNLYNRLFNEIENNLNENDNNLLNDMIIEFRPGLILSAILGQRALILANLPNAKTVVLERFNELLSGKHNLTLNEDIHETFTTDRNKELNNFNNFRIIATCKKGYENRLSEALLSRFTIISVEPYNSDEQKEVLFIKSKGKKKLKENDIERLINYSNEFKDIFNIEFPLTKMVKCLELYEKFYKNNSNVQLFFPFYILAFGLIEKRDENNIYKLKGIDKNVSIPKIEQLDIINENNLKSEFTKMSISSNELKIPEKKEVIYFSKKMLEMLNIIHTGLCTKTPIILEGLPEQGKSTIIKYISDYLNFEIININISKETKVEDLLCQISIEKEENGSIKIKNNETKLLKSLKSHEKNPKSIIVFQNINNASPAVLETLTSISGPINTNILLPNGDTIQKGEVYIILIFNKQNGLSREKLPSSLIHNSLYYVVESPDNNDIKGIIRTLFNYYQLNSEIDNFQRIYFESKYFISEQTNENSLTISDIKKYILFRKKCPTVEPFIITQFIFVYRFTELRLIEESKKKLGLINLLFDPEIDYQKDANNLIIKLIQGKKGSEIIINTYDNKLIKDNIEDIINTFNNITINGKYSLVFLICSVLSKRACILQGDNCSGKTFLIRFLAKMFGRRLIEYQMNSSVGMSLFTRDSIINENLSTFDKKKLENLIDEIKEILELKDTQYSNLTVPEYKEIIKKINSKIEELKEEKKTDTSIDLLIKTKKKISLIISPVNQIQYKESDFIKALRDGEWVLVDGIESAPNQIIEKIISLCGDDPELNIFESGKGIYFSKENKDGSEKINDNFHLFITCNSSKENSKRIDQSLFNKCMNFTSPQIDSKVEDAALVLFSKIKKNNNENILINLSSRLSKFHNYCTTESLKNPYNFAGRIPITPSYLLFSANIFNNSENEPLENKIYSILQIYWKSISEESIKDKFEKESLAKFSEEPFELKIKRNIFEKLNNILIIIKDAQEIILKKNNKNFNLIDFLGEVMNLQLNQADIETIIKHIKDTLNLIENIYNSGRHSICCIRQIEIILKLLKNINEQFPQIEPKYYNTSFNSNEIDEIELIKEPIIKLKLLSELIANKNTFNEKIKLFMFDKNFTKLLKFIDEFIKSNDTYRFICLIEFLKDKKHLLNILDILFPYNNKNLKDFSKKLIFIICLLNKKKINFSFRVEGEHSFKFEYDKDQEDRLNPQIIIKKSEFHFSEGTKLICKKCNYQMKIDKQKNFKPNLETSMLFLQMIEHFANIKNITKNEMNKVYEFIKKNNNNIIIPKENFLLKNLFNDDEKTSKISKIWAIIYNFNDNTKLIEYLINYLLPIESDLIRQFSDAFKNIKSYNINQIINITNQLITFCDENSILWLDTIGKFSIIKSEIDNYLIQVTLEIENLEKLGNSLNIDLVPYIGRLKEIKAELNKDNIDNEKKQRVKNIIDKLKNDLNIYLNNRKYYEYHRIMQKLKTKIINSYEENEEYLLKLEAEKNDLLKYINFNLNKKIQENNIWPMPKTENYSNHPEVILFKYLIWYSKIKSVIQEIRDARDIGIKKGLISKIEKYDEIKQIIEYMEFKLDKKDNNPLNVDDYNYIDSHLRNIFLLKLYEENEEKITYEYFNFEKYINNLIDRIHTNENLYNYIYTIANEYSFISPEFKLILPEFRPLDLIYLFMSRTSRGIKNDLLLKEFPEISVEKIEKLKDDKESDYIKLITKIIILLIQEFFGRDDIDIKLDYDYILNEYIKKNRNINFYKQLGYAMEIAKLLNDKSNSSKTILLYDDLNEFTENNINKGINNFILNEKIANKYPSLLFYFCKYPNYTELLLKELRHNKFNIVDFKNKIKDNNKNDINIPFWIIILRILSSFNQIEYGNNNIFNKYELSLFIREKLKEKIKNNQNINYFWLNLVLENVPKEIMQFKYRIYYEYFNNLSINIICDNIYIKNLIEDIIRRLHKEVISLVLNENESIFPISEDFSIENDLKNIIINPLDFILKKISITLKDKLKELSKIEEIKNLKIALDKYIKDCEHIVKQLISEIIKENNKSEFEYKEKLKKDAEIFIEKELNDLKNKYKLYKNKYENIKDLIGAKKKEEENKNENNAKIIFKLDKKEIEELKEKKKIIEENKEFFNLSNEHFSISKFKYKYKNEGKGKLHIICGTFNETDLPLKNKLYFNDLKKDDFQKIFFIPEDCKDNKDLKIENDFLEETTKMFKIINFYELLPLEEDEKLKIKLKNKCNKIQKNEANIPRFNFNGLSQDDFIEKIYGVKAILMKILDLLNKVKFQFIYDKYHKYLEEFNVLSKEINNNNQANIGMNPCQSIKINEKMEELDNNIDSVDVKLKEFNQKFQSNYMLSLISLYKTINEKKIFSKSFNLEIPKQHNDITNFQFNLEGLKDVDLSIPFISYDNKNNKIEFCYNHFEKIIGPICPNISGQYIEIKILNSIKNKTLITNIEDIKNISTEDIDKIQEFIKKEEKIQVIINDKIQGGEDILIKLKMPELYKDEEETHFYYFNISFKIADNPKNQNILIIPCKFIIKLIPLNVLLISENYNLKVINKRQFKLNTNFVYSNERLIFRLKNYYINYLDYKIQQFQTKIESLDENEVKEPFFNYDINEGKIELIIPEIEDENKENNNFAKIHGKITIALTEEYKIEIEIKAFIIPYKLDMTIYDYTKKRYVNEPIFYFSDEDVKIKDLEIDIYLKIESIFWFKKNKALLDWNIVNKKIEIAGIEKNPICLKENQIINFKLKIKKGFILKEEKGEYIELKINDIDLDLKKQNSIKILIKEGPKININNIQILKDFSCIYYYDIENKNLSQVNDIKKLIVNNDFCNSIISPFDNYFYKLKYFTFNYYDLNQNEKEIHINLNIQSDEIKYYHLNKNGELREGTVNSENLKNGENLLFYSIDFKSTIVSHWNLIFFIVFKFKEKQIWMSCIEEMEKSKFNKWIQENNDEKKIEKINIFEKEFKIYEKHFDNKNPFMNFSDLVYLILKKNDLIENIKKKLIPLLDENDKNKFTEIYQNFSKCGEKEKKLIKYNIIIFMFKLIEENKNLYKNKEYGEYQIEEQFIKDKVKKLRQNYYLYNLNEEKEIKSFNSNEIQTLINNLKKFQNEPNPDLSENIYLIYDKTNPEIKTTDNKIIDIKQKNEINEIKQINSQNEPPPFKSNMEVNIKFSNIKDIVEYYNNCISDTNILPLHLIKLIYNTNLSSQEQKELNKELEKRFTKLLLTYKDLKFEEEDCCIIYKIIKEFKESMDYMLLKFEKGKTNFKEYIPDIKLNKKTLNKVYTVSEKPKFKLEIKRWGISIIKKENIFTKNKILGFQSEKKRKINLEENNNILKEKEDIKENYKINEKKSLKQNNQNKKTINIDSQEIEMKNEINIQERYVSNIDYSINTNQIEDINKKKDKNKKIKDNKNKDYKDYKDNIKDEEKNDKEKKIIKVLKRSSDDTKEINNLKKEIDMNPNIPESEIDYQIKLIIDKIKAMKPEDDFKIENEPKKKHLISENLLERNKNNQDILNMIINLGDPIASKIIIEVSKKNLKEYIPFKDLEVNLIVDCSRYIPNDAKYFNVILTCAIAMALNALKIRYSIGLVADYSFKVELKKINNEHSIEYFQMLLDCIFLPRLMTHYASCLNYVIDKFETRNKISSERVFVMISNGLDKELKLTKKWSEKIFSNDKHSFLFLFNEPKLKEKEILEFLRNDIWESFRNPKEVKYKSTVKVMNFDQKIDDNFKKKLSENLTFCLTRKILSDIEEKNFIKNYNQSSPKFKINEQALTNDFIKKNIDFLRQQIGTDYKKFKEPYLIKIEHPNENIDIRQGDINILTYSNHQNKIIDSNFSREISDIIYEFTKNFKEKKENINLSSLDIIFQPNLPTQYVLSTKGSIIDMDAFFKYFLNPTPNPMFYKELDGGYVKNYGVTLVIDTSLSCMNYFTYDHYLDTIRIILTILSLSELPNFDLVITGTPNPIIICSELSTSNALNEKSLLWGNLYASLAPIYESDLSSAIKVAYDLNNIRRNESTNYIFVVTDGLFSIPEQKVISENVKICENKGINVFGIGVGIYPKGLENIFTNIIFSQNPYNLINAISGFFGEINTECKEMPYTEIISNIKDYRPSTEILNNLNEKPEYYKLKEQLKKILFVPESIPMYNEEDEIDLDISLAHKENVILKPTYSENCLKGQKLLIVMLWSHEMDSKESNSVDEKYIYEPYNGARSCIKKQLDFYGIEIKVVKNYIDAIKELTSEDDNLKGKCKYFAAIVMNGPNYAILPGQKNEVEEARYILQFLEALKIFWENGGGVLLFNENEPFFFQTNLFLNILEFPGDEHKKVNFKLYGNHKGGQEMIANNEGDLSQKGTFTRKRSVIDSYQRSIIGHGLTSINEGITLSYIDYEPEKIKPFIPFSRDNEGGVNSLYYIGKNGRGDIIIDNSYTKFLSDLKNESTAKLIQNMIAWIARVDYHYMMGNDPRLYRPKIVDFKFDPSQKCSKDLFARKKQKEEEALEMKTILAIDYSGSVQNKANYHDYIKNKILPKYYKRNRGDIIYIWETNYKKISYQEMMDIVNNRKGSGGTNSSKIANILSLEANNNFKHLLIVTDGEVDKTEIEKSDNIMKSNNNIKLEFVSTFIIKTSGTCNLSVGAPYCRNVPNSTIYVSKEGKEIKQPSLFEEDLNEWKQLETNIYYTQDDFLKNYTKIENAVKAKTLGSSSGNVLQTLSNFKERIKGNAKVEFINKIEYLIKLAKEGNMDLSLKVT